VRRGRESAYDRKAPHGLPPPSLVPTNLFDLWAQQWRKRHARGGMIIVRFADDTVLGFEYESDAKRRICAGVVSRRRESVMLCER